MLDIMDLLVYISSDMFFRTKKSGLRQYLQIVHNRRDKGSVKQEVIATIGWLDVLRSTGALESFLRSGVRFSEKLALIDSTAAEQRKYL